MAIPIGYVVYDAEKDHFPDIQVPTPMIHGFGEPIHRYLSRLSGVRVSYKSYRRLKSLAGMMGAREIRVDDVRLEISLRPLGNTVRESVKLPLTWAQRSSA